MGYPPGQQLTVRDGGIGLTSSSDLPPLVVGVTSGGVADTLYSYSDPNKLLDDQGDGPAVELGAAVLPAAGSILLLKTNAGTAGSNSAVSKTAVGTSTGTVTVAGTPRDGYEFIGTITKTGTLGTGKFKYSLDDGYTTSDELTIPAGGTYAIPNTALTITFVAGGGPTFFELGDKHEFDSVAPHYTTANLGTAVTALLAQLGNKYIHELYFAGKNSSAANAATMAAAISTHMTTLQSRGYYCRALMDAGNDTPANVLTSFASFSDARVGVCFGDADVVGLNPYAGWGVPKRAAVNVVAERAAGSDLSENLGRKESGLLRGVRAISHDEGTNQQFSEADKITTLRTYQGQAGFFVTNGYLKSPSGSDFLYWDWGRVIDVMCRTVFAAQDKWLLKKLRSLKDGTGRIDPRDGSRVNAAVRRALKAVLLDPTNIEGYKGHVSGLSYAVDETNDFLSSREMLSAAFAVPLVPVETIKTQLGFARSVS
jgi:hypothetical protein